MGRGKRALVFFGGRCSGNFSQKPSLLNCVAWIHLFWILFGIFSLPLLFIVSWWNRVALIFAGITVFSWILFRGCWFLQIENKLRRQYDISEAFEEEAFIQHYLKKYFAINCSRTLLRISLYSYMAVMIYFALLAVAK